MRFYSNHYVSLLISLLLLAQIISCEKAAITLSVEEKQEIAETVVDFVTTEGQTVLGDVIEIPYSIENLRKAYEKLSVETRAQINLSDIQPTHYYVRFYPKTIAELDTLRNIKPYVFLSETPLDRKVVVGGSSYHDPSIPEDLPTFQYTVVPVWRWAELRETVPVEAEILIEAYMPDYDEPYTTKSASRYGIPADAYDALLKVAYEMTGNQYYPQTRASWTPSGTIQAYDDTTNLYLPVPGVRVRATHLLTVKETLTDVFGCFTLPSFKSSVSYKIIWESDEWDIRDGLVGQATFDGPTQQTSWYPMIGVEHEKNVRYAATHRALYKCYYQYIEGLMRPNFSSKLKICQRVANSSYPSVFTNDNLMGWHIESWIYNADGNLRKIHAMYYNIAHEIGHAAHYSHNNNDYNNYSKAIKESWALFYGLKVYEKEYGVNYEYYDYYENNWPYVPNVRYSPVFIDLYDNHNQSEPTHTVYPNDFVTGYSCSTLSDILNNSTYTLGALKQAAKQNLPTGVIDSDVDTLFIIYGDNWIDDYN